MSVSVRPGQSLPVRVFRADAPQEVASASIVASALAPGRNILAIYGGSSYGPPEAAVANLRAMARAHPWAAIVDLSDLPLKEVSGTDTSLGARLARTRATVAAIKGIRDRLAGPLGVSASAVERALNEVYVSVLTADTMVTAYGLSRSAQMCCYPHTFTSVGHERYQLEFPSKLPGRVADIAKRIVWGPEAVPRRRIHLDVAVSFWRQPEWATQTVSLVDLITETTMRQLFSCLPDGVRGYFQRLAARFEAAPAVLLLESGDAKRQPRYQEEVEMEAYLRLIDHLVQRERIRSLIVKPHPRIRPDRAEEVSRVIASRFPQLQVATLAQHSSLPIEVVSVPFKPVACASIISTALCTLPLVYELRSYCDRSAADALYGEPSVNRILAEWFERVPGRLNVLD